MTIGKATEVVFMRRVISCDSGITMEKNIGLKIESSVVKQFGPNHFYDYHIGQERDHLTNFFDEIDCSKVHKNLPSSRHELSKTILKPMYTHANHCKYVDSFCLKFCI